MIHIITVAFSNWRQLKQSVLRFYDNEDHGIFSEYKRYVISGHYPLNHDENEHFLKRVIGDAIWLDPDEDLGSAQTQCWALNQIKPAPEDYIVNLDPDSACDVPVWLDAMKDVMDEDKTLSMVHLTNPYVWERIRFRYNPFTFKEVAGHKLAIPMSPEQFNITMYRVSALDSIGGILQDSPYYGNVEGRMWNTTRELGMSSAYLTDYIEAYDLKPMEDKEFFEWKMAHCHSERFGVPYFPGKFGEFCKSKGYA